MAGPARNLNNFFVAASSFLMSNSKENLVNLTSTLQIISVEQDLRTASPGDVCKFFDVFSQVFDEVPTKAFLYSTLKSVVCNKNVLRELRECRNLCQQLFNQLPTQDEISELGSHADYEIRDLQKLLEVLELISLGFTAFWDLISLHETLYRLSKLFVTNDLPDDVTHLVLVTLLNVCSANHASISVASALLMRVDEVAEKLMVLSSEEAFNASSHSLMNAHSEPRFSTPLLVTHLLVKLEKLCGRLAKVKFLERVTWSFQLLVDGISNRDANVTTHAANFLTEFVSMPEKREFLMRHYAFDSKLQGILEALSGVGSINTECNRAVLMLLTSLLDLVPSDENPESLSTKLVAIVNLCNNFMAQSLPDIKHEDTEQACLCLELAESCMSLSHAVLVRLKQWQLCGNNLPVLQDCVQQSASLILLCFDSLREDVSLEAQRCITIAFQLLCQACKSSNLAATVLECLSEDKLNVILSRISSMNASRHKSPMVVWGVSLVTCINQWDQLKSKLFSSQDVCYHIAYTMKCCRCKDTLCAFLILEKLPEQSMKIVSQVLEYFPCGSPSVVNTSHRDTTASSATHVRHKECAIYSLRDKATLMEVIDEVNRSLQKPSGTDGCNLDLLAIVELYKLQHRDTQAQVTLLQRCIATAESVAAQQSLSMKQMDDQLEATRERLVQATKRSQAVDILNQSQQKRLKEFEKNNRELIKENKTLHSQNVAMTAELGQKLQATQDQCKELQEANAVMEEKLARYKKEMALFKQKNTALQEENSSLKSSNLNLNKENGNLRAECDEHKRIQATVQKLMLGGSINRENSI